MMPNLTMDVYSRSTGVQITIELANEDEYQQTKTFLMDLGAGCGESSERREGLPAFFYLQNADHLSSFFEFTRSLVQKRKG